jgi:hypothetical protein
MRKVNIMPQWIAIVLMASILVLLALLILRKPIDTGLTEIYFTEDLPKEIVYGDEYSFSFIIHSRENVEHLYFYRIIRNGLEMNSGYVSVKPDQRALVTQAFTPKPEETEIKFDVIVDDKTIHFWSVAE